MQSKLEKPEFYLEFMIQNENRLRECLSQLTARECIDVLHRYLGNMHQGILQKDLTRIETNYESIQTILEIYYEKIKEK